jgi:hypothetical protein
MKIPFLKKFFFWNFFFFFFFHVRSIDSFVENLEEMMEEEKKKMEAFTMCVNVRVPICASYVALWIANVVSFYLYSGSFMVPIWNDDVKIKSVPSRR